MQESKRYPPKTWPTFNRSKQIVYHLPDTILITAVIDNIIPVNNYRSRFNRAIVQSPLGLIETSVEHFLIIKENKLTNYLARIV